MESQKNSDKSRSLEEKLLDYTYKNLFGGKRSQSVEEAFEKALDLSEEEEPENDGKEESWI